MQFDASARLTKAKDFMNLKIGECGSDYCDIVDADRGVTVATFHELGAPVLLFLAAEQMLAALKLPEPTSGCFCTDCVAARKARTEAVRKAKGQ